MKVGISTTDKVRIHIFDRLWYDLARPINETKKESELLYHMWKNVLDESSRGIENLGLIYGLNPWN